MVALLSVIIDGVFQLHQYLAEVLEVQTPRLKHFLHAMLDSPLLRYNCQCSIALCVIIVTFI